jgi:hypothetical protein
MELGIAAGYGLDGPGSVPGAATFSVLHSVRSGPNRLWGPPSLLSNGYRWSSAPPYVLIGIVLN